MSQEISDYNAKQTPGDRATCELLEQTIREVLGEAESKIWHGSPVWFLDGNPIVGYHKLKHHVRVLFWSGQTFAEPGLIAGGSFKAAEAQYKSIEYVDVEALKRWLVESRDVQWDYKNIVKRKGELVRLK